MPIREANALDFSNLLPKGESLFDYQHLGIAYALLTRKCFIADEQGLGKTRQALVACKAAGIRQRIIVVCKASLKGNWARECERILPEYSVEVVSGRQPYQPSGDIVIVNYDILADWEPVFVNPEALILDESHYCKESKTKRTKAALALSTRVPADGLVLLLTGTPILNRPVELASQLRILGRIREIAPRPYRRSDEDSSWEVSFKHRYCNTPEAPVWMGDKTFLPLGKVEVGDQVMGWTKKPGGHSHLTKATVTAVHHRTTKVVKVTLASGAVIRCTPDHQWLSGRSNRVKECWVHPQIGRQLVKVIDPTPELLSRLQTRVAGWLGGIYDGEATREFIAQHKSANPAVHEAIGKALSYLGLSYTEGPEGFWLTGGRQTFTNFLTYCQPVKGDRLEAMIETSHWGGAHDEIVSVEADGEDEVVSLTTTTHNYVAWGYASHNCGAEHNGYGWTYTGSSNLLELNEKMRAVCFVRRLRNDVLGMNETRRYEVPLSLNGALDTYRRAEHDFMRFLLAEEGKEAVEKAKRAEVLVQMNTLRQLAGQAKVEAAADWINDWLDENPDRKLVVFAWHIEVQEAIAKATGGIYLRGAKDIEAAKREFNEGDARVIVCSLQAHREGHTLVGDGHNVQDVLFIENPWNAGSKSQAEDRINRIGQEAEQVFAWTFLAQGADIDTWLSELVEAKRAVSKAAIDGADEEDDTNIQDEIIRRFREKGQAA